MSGPSCRGRARPSSCPWSSRACCLSCLRGRPPRSRPRTTRPGLRRTVRVGAPCSSWLISDQGAAGVAVVVPVVVPVVPVVPPPPGVLPFAHEPSAETATSPWFTWALTAFLLTEIFTQGFDFDPVLWQRVTFRSEEVVVVPVVPVPVVPVEAVGPALCGLPLPGGGAAIANDAAMPATKRQARSAFVFIWGVLSLEGAGWLLQRKTLQLGSTCALRGKIPRMGSAHKRHEGPRRRGPSCSLRRATSGDRQ